MLHHKNTHNFKSNSCFDFLSSHKCCIVDTKNTPMSSSASRLKVPNPSMSMPLGISKDSKSGLLKGNLTHIYFILFL